MSVAEEKSDIDLQHDLQSEHLQDAQVDPDQSHATDEELDSVLSSDDIIPIDEAGPSNGAGFTTSVGRQSDVTRTVPDVAADPFAEEPSYFTRPNRYFGPDSTWLSWTREERVVAETLDHLRSQDLSIHLFNAYALKKAGLTIANRSTRDIKGKGKARATSGSDGTDTEAEVGGIFPPRAWTAWPLPPHQVPRVTNERDCDQSTFRSKEDLRPSAELEESLVATTLRFARERWNSRSWEPEIASQRGMKVEHDSDVEMAESVDQTAEQSPTIVEDTDAADTFSTDSSSDSEVFISQRWDLDQEPTIPTASATKKNPSFTAPEGRPTPIADDDAAKDLLLPGTRHVLSKFDDLLMALHTARQSYVVRHHKSKHSKDEARDTSDDSDSAASRSWSRKRKRSASVTSHRSATPNATPTHKAQHPQLNPRDWSDVLGMAVLTDFSPAVIQRASARCATLFNSNMLFRTFHPPSPATKRTSYTTHHALSPTPSPSPSPNLTPKKKATLTLPTTSIRTSRACTTCSSLRRRCLPSTSTPSTGPCRRCIASNTAESCSGITTKAASISGTRCPYASCDRHYSPFKKSYHLQRHLDRVHLGSGGGAGVASPVPSSASEGLSASSTDGPNAKNIRCPVPGCPRHESERGFSRGARLYKHISAMHPEVDVEQVKKLERLRRGDGRGKWKNEERRSLVGARNRRKGVTRPVVGGRGVEEESGDGGEDEDSGDDGDGVEVAGEESSVGQITRAGRGIEGRTGSNGDDNDNDDTEIEEGYV